MRKPDLAALSKLSPEALIEGFVYEAKCSAPAMPMSVKEMNEHGERSRAYAAQIIASGGSMSLLSLMNAPDPWLASCAARALVVHEETKEFALVALDRLAEGVFGAASSSANTARNMIRFGNPFGDPIEVKKRRENRARDAAQ